MGKIDPDRAKVAQGPRPHYFDDANVDRLWTVTLALLGEVSILRDRLDAHERLSARAGGYGVEDVDAFEPDPEEAADRGRRREALVRRSLRSIELEMELLASKQPAGKPYREPGAD
jgi:hypothetical protein